MLGQSLLRKQNIYFSVVRNLVTGEEQEIVRYLNSAEEVWVDRGQPLQFQERKVWSTENSERTSCCPLITTLGFLLRLAV